MRPKFVFQPCNIPTWVWAPHSHRRGVSQLTFAEGRLGCLVESDVSWGWVNRHSKIDEQEQLPVSARAAQWILRPVWTIKCGLTEKLLLSDFFLVLTWQEKNAAWVVTNHLTHCNSRSERAQWTYKRTLVRRSESFRAAVSQKGVRWSFRLLQQDLWVSTLIVVSVTPG